LDGHGQRRRRIESWPGRKIQCRSASARVAWRMMEAGGAGAYLRGTRDGDAAPVAPGWLQRRHGAETGIADAGKAVEAEACAADFTSWREEGVEEPAEPSWCHGGPGGRFTVSAPTGRSNPGRCLGEGEV
jgi:hypothetical protein